MPAADVTRPLLDALDDPNRFVAAHLWLCQKQYARNSLLRERADHLLAEHDGLRAILRPSMLSYNPEKLRERMNLNARQNNQEYFEICTQPHSLYIDPSQLPRIRRQWHDRLDVRVLSIPHIAVMAMTVTPLVILARQQYRLSRAAAAKARGLCPVCHYDLRASNSQCPECGAPIEQDFADAAMQSTNSPP